MTLSQLQAFRVLAETLHYMTAADQLHVSQPALSRSIAALEKELGAELFEKAGRNIRLSRYGTLFYGYIEPALEQIRLGVGKLHALTDPAHGEINLGLTFPLGPSIVPNILRRFSGIPENSGFRLRLFQNNSDELIGYLKDNTCDLALCSEIEGEPSICFFPLFRSRPITIVPRNHPLVGKGPVTLKELANYGVIMNPEKAPFILREFHSRGLEPEILSLVHGECAIAGMVSIGYGIAFVDENTNLTNTDVELLEVPELNGLQISTCLAYKKDAWQSPAVCALKEFLQREIHGNWRPE